MKKLITWKQEDEFQINGYIGKDCICSIASFYNRNYAVVINDQYKGETWLVYKNLCFKTTSVMEAMAIMGTIVEKNKLPPRQPANFKPPN